MWHTNNMLLVTSLPTSLGALGTLAVKACAMAPAEDFLAPRTPVPGWFLQYLWRSINKGTPVVESTREEWSRRRRLLRKALLDYEAEHRMPFTLRHLTRDALNHMEALKAEIMAKWNLPY
ncbi:hypothetical protein Tco_0398315 [Tanacetum coccineum]